VKNTIFVELFEEHEAANLYTIRFQTEKDSETERFFSVFDTAEFADDINIIIASIDKIGLQGVQDRYFRVEGGMLKALAFNSVLRLFCYKVSDEILIVGNGGIKKTKTYNEDPVLNKHAEVLRGIGNMLMARLNKGTAQEYNKQLFGNLEFYI
jgi:hypothetical protein